MQASYFPVLHAMLPSSAMPSAISRTSIRIRTELYATLGAYSRSPPTTCARLVNREIIATGTGRSSDERVAFDVSHRSTQLASLGRSLPVQEYY